MKYLRLMIFLLLAGTVFAEDVNFIELSYFRHRIMDGQAFEVKRDIEIAIDGRGASDRREYDMLAYGWILDSRTRDVVWEMTVDNTDEVRRSRLRRVDETIRLPKGEYEVYFAAATGRIYGSRYRNLGDVIDDVIGGYDRDWRREARAWGLTLSIDEADENAVELISFPEEEDAIVHIAPLGDDEYESVGFVLRRQARVRVYAMGEGDDDEMVDYAWIVDVSNNRTVWEMDYWDSRRAGGAEKNRIIDDQITLGAGEYVVHCVTDGSHSYDEWNALPPYDPQYWGITLWGVNGNEVAELVEPYDPEKDRELIVDLTRFGDDEFDTESFSLSRTADVYVRCIGEYGYQDEFVDYGWIMNAKTRETVWEMQRRNTKRAGGAQKNRMFEGVITLEAGDYEVCYISDGSHSYRDWNSGPPYDPKAWGIAVWGAGENFDSRWVKSYEPEDDPNILVEITRVGDHERIRRRFVLDEETRVRIYCLGEGDYDDMYDYGWIENDRGRKVWDMDYRYTERAGGGRKNRMINEVIRLDAGEYTVFYRSDGSHSYDDWNDDPPRDPVHWGIMVIKEQ